MSDTEYSDDITERFVTNPTDKTHLEAIEISHPDADQDFYLVGDRKSWDFTLEDGSVITHQPYGFAIKPPQSDSKGNPEMSIAIDNTDRFAHKFLEQVKTSTTPITITYRVYLMEDPTTPQIIPPIKMSMSAIKIDTFQISGRASFVDVLKAPFLHENYDRDRFPSIGD